MIITEDDRKRETQSIRCKMMLREYFIEQGITIDVQALLKRLTPDPLLFQFCHEVGFKKKDWKEALRWTMDNKHLILAYSRGEMDEWGTPIHESAGDAATGTDREAHRDDAKPRDKGQSLSVGDDGVSLGREEHST